MSLFIKQSSDQVSKRTAVGQERTMHFAPKFDYPPISKSAQQWLISVDNNIDYLNPKDWHPGFRCLKIYQLCDGWSILKHDRWAVIFNLSCPFRRVVGGDKHDLLSRVWLLLIGVEWAGHLSVLRVANLPQILTPSGLLLCWYQSDADDVALTLVMGLLRYRRQSGLKQWKFMVGHIVVTNKPIMMMMMRHDRLLINKG